MSQNLWLTKNKRSGNPKRTFPERSWEPNMVSWD